MFCIGDKVIVKNFASKYSLQQGVVTDLVNFSVSRIHLDSEPFSMAFLNNELEKIYEEVPYITVAGTKYSVIKKISGMNVWNACSNTDCEEFRREFDNFIYSYSKGYTNEIALLSLENMCLDHPKRLAWLIHHGFLLPKKKKEKKTMVFENVDILGNSYMPTKIGARFNVQQEDAERKMTILNKKVKMTLEWEE